MEIQIEALGKILGVAIGLGGEVAGIHPDHWNLSASIHPAQHVEQHRGLDSEARGQGKTRPKLLMSPQQPCARIQRLKLLTRLLKFSRISLGASGNNRLILGGGDIPHLSIFQCHGAGCHAYGFKNHL